MKKFIVILVIMTLPMIAMAKSVRIDNIEYELYTEAGSNILCARVIRNYWKPKMHAYKGDVVIPEKIVYKKKEYIVREIGKQKLASHAAYPRSRRHCHRGLCRVFRNVPTGPCSIVPTV